MARSRESSAGGHWMPGARRSGSPACPPRASPHWAPLSRSAWSSMAAAPTCSTATTCAAVSAASSASAAMTAERASVESTSWPACSPPRERSPWWRSSPPTNTRAARFENAIGAMRCRSSKSSWTRPSRCARSATPRASTRAHAPATLMASRAWTTPTSHPVLPSCVYPRRLPCPPRWTRYSICSTQQPRVRWLPAEQHQPDGNSGAHRYHQSKIPCLRRAAFDRPLHHVEDRRRAHVAVLGQHVIAGRDVLAGEVERFLHALDDAPPAWVHEPVIDRRALQAACAKEIVYQLEQAVTGDVGKLADQVQVAVLRRELHPHGAERARHLVDLGGEHRRTGRARGRLVELDQGRRATVAEDRGADRLAALVVLGCAHQYPGHALGREHERLLARPIAQGLRGEPHERHSARATDAHDVVLVGCGVHLVVIHEPVSDRRPAERVERGAYHYADIRWIDVQLVDRSHRIAEQVLLDRVRAALDGRREKVVGQREAATLHAAATEDALG